MTELRDSKVDKQWLARAMAAHPPKKLENGNMTSGPVRLSFVNLMTRGKAQRRDDGTIGEGKFGCTVLFPTGDPVYMGPLYAAWYEEAGRCWSSNWDAASQRYYGLEWPFHDQAGKAVGQKPLKGYTPGCLWMNISSNYQPPVTDALMAEVSDEKRVYAGVWAIVAMNTYEFGKSPPRPKKGVGFGVQGVVLIGDDTRLGGGAPDQKTVFAGVDLQSMVDPTSQFGGVRPGAPPMPPGGGLPVHALPPHGSVPSYPTGTPGTPPAQQVGETQEQMIARLTGVAPPREIPF